MVQKRKLISFFNQHLLGCELLTVEDQNGRNFFIKPCEIQDMSHFEALFGKSAVKDLLNCFLLESRNSADMIERKLAQTVAQNIKKLGIIKDVLLISQAFEHQFVKTYLSQLKEKQIEIFTKSPFLSCMLELIVVVVDYTNSVCLTVRQISLILSNLM